MKIGTPAILLAVLLACQAAWAQQPPPAAYLDQPVMPEGRKGELIRALIETINSADPARIETFIKESFAERFRNLAPLEGHVSVFLNLYNQTGGMDFHGIRTFTPERPGETVVIVRDRLYENWNALTVRFGGAPDFLIASCRFGSARTPTDVEEAPLGEAEVLRQVEETVARLVSRNAFSGALLLAKGPTVLFETAAGEASKSYHVPNNMDTKFNLGSMNKMFTSLAVARLAEQGKLSFDDPLSKYLDESWLPRTAADKITLRHLLTHSSGLGSYFNDVYDRSSRALFRRLDDYKPLIRDDKPAFEPGSRYQYSNTGMFLLGAVIEKATGEDYFEHIRRVIYEPAGMRNSDCYEMDRPVENLAVGYSPDPQSPYGWRNNLYTHVLKGGPAGGGFSTVRDLYRFALALGAGKYVSSDTLKLMWTDALGAGYGYGFVIAQTAAGKAVGHSGGFDGINSKLDIYTEAGYIVAVMSNVDGGANPLAQKIGSLLGRMKTEAR